MKKLFKKAFPFILVVILLTSLITSCNQQTNPQENDVEASSQNSVFTNIYENLIDSSYAMDVIKELSSEKYLGRLTGTEGNALAVDYIVNQFKEIGLICPQTLENYKQFYTQKTIINESAPY